MSPSFGLSFDAKARLIARLTSRMGTDSPIATRDENELDQAAPPLGDPDVIDGLRMLRRSGDILGIENPYFVTHTGIAGARTVIGNRSFDNFVSYNYLGLNGDPRVSDAAKAAIDRYGTSVSASRVVSGERPIHRALEEALAEANGTEDALAFVSGHATNVTVIGHLVGPRDAIVHDALCHNSIMQGIQLSGAQRVPFAHNDLAALDLKLTTIRPTVNRVLVIVEGHYSMDGDIPDLHGLVRLARRHRASLMVDEAHSLGVLGATGLGIAEHCGVDPRAIDLWMGTLSKTLSSSGGYVAGSKSLIDYLRCSAPGFVYSVGLAPATAAAAAAALQIMRSEPERVAKLADNAAYFLTCARGAGLQTGASIGAAIIPVMLGSSIRTAKVSDALRAGGINVQPIMHPAVPERAARLRFFITALHTRDQLEQAVDQTAQLIATVASDATDLPSLALKLASSSWRR
jgi:8-amino-7-oxononanoate synthase